MNICKDCNIEKPINDFRKDKNYQLGVRNRCKLCRADFRKKRKEQINEQKRILYKNSMTEEKRKNLNLKAKQLYTNNFFNNLIYNCKRKQRTRNLQCDINIEDLKKLYNYQNKKCYYCNVVLNTVIGNKSCDQISIDRKDSNQGYIKNNIVLTCLFCNYAKNISSVEHFKNFINTIKNGDYHNDNLIYDKYWVRKLYNLIIQRDINTDITQGWIQNQIIKQNYLCYHSGLKMIITETSRYPFKPSIERLNNNISYKKDNCVLVCLGINYGRSNNQIEELQKHLKKIRNILSDFKIEN